MLKLIKRIRQRFGISAPRMTVRTHVAWYWRWMLFFILLSLSLTLAAWMYDAGRRFAGFDRSEIEQEVARLRAEMATMKQDTGKLRALADAGESRVRMERGTQAQLAGQVRQLEEENARLKEDLAFFENLIPAEKGEGKVSINRFTVVPDALAGEYRYRLLVLQGGKRDKEQQSAVQFLVEMQRDGKTVMMALPSEKPGSDPAYRFNFKYFHRVEGSFRVPPAARVKSVQVRVFDTVSGQLRASQNFSLP
ncbi:MAG: hypothetical protein NT115_05645 [Proteobacteria bacterium]|nr:hypothetical protein [Pseudomonadota bacterium]